MKFKLFYNIRERLKEKLSGMHHPDFLRDIESKTLDQILHEMNFNPNRDYKGLMATYAFEVLRSLKHDADNIEHLIKAHNIVKKSTELQESCYYELDSILAEYIMETKSLPQLFSLSGIAIQIKKLNENYKESYICTGNQFVSLLYDCINELDKTPSEERALEVAKYLKSFIKREFDVVFVVDLFCDIILTFIKKRNQLFNESDNGIPVNVQSDLKIIDYMMRCKLSEANINDLKSCEEILLGRGQREVKKKDRIEDFKAYEITENLDISLLDRKSIITQASADSFTFALYNVFLKEEKYKLKECTIKNSLSKSLKSEILQQFENEAKCYSFLHNKYNVENDPSKSNFAKFLGSSMTNNTFKIVYEDFGEHLIFYMGKIKNEGSKISKKILKEIIKNLLEAFTELENHSIYHQNISLTSIKIDQHLKIKIVDFNYAAVDEASGLQNISKDILRQRFYWPKMVEKSVGKLGKQDVFALGLVILQLYTLEIFDEPKDEQFLENKIAEIGENDITDLLKSMLTFNCSERPRFKNLGSIYYHEGSTASRGSSHEDSIVGSDSDSDRD